TAVGLHLAADVEGAGAVARAVGDLGGAKAARGGEHVDGLQEARLARAVAAEQEMGAGRRAPGEGLEVAKVARGEMGERAQILIGMITQRYRASGPSIG